MSLASFFQLVIRPFPLLALFAAGANATFAAGVSASGGEPEHFIFTGNTGANASIIFPPGSLIGFENGDEIGVFNLNGNLTGAGLYQGTTMVIAAWGNDVSSGDDEHMAELEPYTFRVWKAALEQEFPLSVTFSDGPDYYTTNGISTVATGQYVITAVQTGYTALPAYPNPAHSALHIDLPEGVDGSWKLTVCNASGALVHTVEMIAGDTDNNLQLEVSHWAPGIYHFVIHGPDKRYASSVMVAP